MSLWTNILARADLRSRERRAEMAHREAMRALQEALTAAESAHKTRDEFLSRMSHELRTPLNAVIGLSRVLEKNSAGNLRPEDIHLLGRVRAGGEQLLRLVEDVLDQSLLEGGCALPAISDADVVGIATNVVRHYRTAAAAKGLRMLAVLPESAPTVRLDAGRFEQVLQNIVDNAVKFTVSGDVKVTLASDAATRKPTRMIVSDTGIGIPRDQIERIFMPFEQVDASTRRNFDGAGLGLPLARRLCEGMGCRLTVESESGRGSRFTIRFPGE
jgi:signal transduction histidine kinase